MEKDQGCSGTLQVTRSRQAQQNLKEYLFEYYTGKDGKDDTFMTSSDAWAEPQKNKQVDIKRRHEF